MSGRLDGHVAVVTGGATGIGRAYVRKLAADGASVAILDLVDGADAVADVEAAGSKGASFIVDVTDADQVGAAVGDIQASLGAADILINNAGIYPNQMFADMSIADWRRMFTVNVESMFITAQAFTPSMKERGWGRIVNMSSNSVHLVIPGFTHYIASKMAVIGLTRGLATELAEFGITANAIGPSLTRTASTEKGPEIFFEIVPQMQAIKRLQLPEDLAGTLAFLCSDDAAFVTGQTFWVDGGLVRSG
jgi:NAD(P)-dependent dehydrogenase (short-subunit alcohol dehydrogenase family)